jgi:hypothetical protein
MYRNERGNRLCKILAYLRQKGITLASINTGTLNDSRKPHYFLKMKSP